jgi:hypothetical protein
MDIETRLAALERQPVVLGVSGHRTLWSVRRDTAGVVIPPRSTIVPDAVAALGSCKTIEVDLRDAGAYTTRRWSIWSCAG